MGKYLINEPTIQSIADAIRDKNGSSTTYTPSELANAIIDIVSGDFLTPLCFTSEQNGSRISIYIRNLSLSLKISFDGENWSDWNFSAITLNAGDKVYLKGDNTTMRVSDSSYAQFTITGKVYASGNIMSLLDSTGRLLSMSGRSFGKLFQGCTGLVSSPELPAISLSNSCYNMLFSGCTTLKRGAFIPALDIPYKACCNLYSHCSSLIDVPDFICTSVGSSGFSSAFWDCTSLIIPPELPATRIGDYGYSGMFAACTSLIRSPYIPNPNFSGIIQSMQYSSMFNGCSNLSEIRVGATTWDSRTNGIYRDWVSGVAAAGTFYKPSGTTIPTGNNGIPSGWTVVNV